MTGMEEKRAAEAPADQNPAQQHCLVDDSVSVPLLGTTETPTRLSLFSKALSVVWNSCTCCGLLAALFATAAIVGIKLLDEAGVSVFEFVAFRAIVYLVFSMPSAYWQTGFWIGPSEDTTWILVRAVLSAAGFVLAAATTILLTVSEAALFTNSYPAVLAILVWLMGLESPDWIAWIGVFGTVIANVLIARPPFLTGDGDTEWDLSRWMGLLSALVCVIVMAMSFICVRKLTNVPSVLMSIHVQITLFLISLPFCAMGYPKKVIWKPSSKQLLLLVMTSSSALNQFFIVRSFVIGPSIKAAMVSLTRILMMLAGGVVLLSDKITMYHTVGSVVMLASIILVIWSGDRAKKQIQIHRALADGLSERSSI